MHFFVFFIRVRVLFGGRQGEFRFLPPAGFSPCTEALLPKTPCKLKLFHKLTQNHIESQRDLLGPVVPISPVTFIPIPVDSSEVLFNFKYALIILNLASVCLFQATIGLSTTCMSV